MDNPIYITATGLTPAELDQQVNSLLADGFGLYGGPYSVRNEQGFPRLCQAMTKDNNQQSSIGFGLQGRSNI